MLEYWLGQCYHASIRNDSAEVFELFKRRLEADQNLKKEAQQKLTEAQNANRHAEIAGGGRCFLSKKYTEILQSVLS